MVTEEEVQSQYSIHRILVLALLILAPIAYLVLVYFLFRNGDRPVHPNEQLFYLFLAVSAISGAVIPIAERRTLASYTARRLGGKQLLEAAQACTLVRPTVTSSVYAFGIIFALTTGTVARLPYFYAFGILYSILYWPSEARFRRIVEQLEAK